MVTLSESYSQEAENSMEWAEPSPWFDLTAQSFMALFALGQVILTGVGIHYIRKTLASTDKAVDEANKATLAAQEAVDVTRESAERQLRAYMDVSEFFVSGVFLNSQPRAHFTLKNCGATPAKRVRVYGMAGLVENARRFHVTLSRAKSGTADWGPGQLALQDFKFLPDPFALKDADDLHAGHREFLIAGYVVYEDAFGKTRRHAFRAISPREDPIDGKIRLYRYKTRAS